MKKMFLLTISICSCLSIFAQNPEDIWTKDAKTQLANECIAVLTTKYPELAEGPRESAAVCYANAIVNSHPKRSEWVNLMEIEIKKEKSNTMNQCIKSSGIEAVVAAPKKEEPKAPTLNKELLVAAWKVGEEEYTLAESGTSLYQTRSKKCLGTWALENRTLTITPKGSMWGKLDPCSKTKVFEIISFTDNELVVMDNAEKQKIHLIKEK